MPLGAFRINSIAKVLDTGGASVSADKSYDITNYNYVNTTYQMQRISYVGDDSSGQPVWFVGTKDGNGNFACILIKRKNDDTIEESSLRTLKNTDERFAAQSCAAKDTSGNDVGAVAYTYRTAGVIHTSLKVMQIDKDNLTLGTTYGIDDFEDLQPNAGLAYVTNPGNGRVIAGFRKSGIRTDVFEIGTSSVTQKNTPSSMPFGDGVYQHIEGYPYAGSSNLRYAGYNGNASTFGLGHYTSDTTHGGYSATDSDVNVGSLAPGVAFPANSTSMIGVAGQNGGLEAIAFTSINWSGTPTYTDSGPLIMSDDSTNQSHVAAALDPSSEKVYALYRDGASTWTFTSLSLVGGTLTEGTPAAIGATTTNWSTSGLATGDVANSSQGNLFCTMIPATSGNSQLYIKDVDA
jgi:hypothetical protein